VSFRHPQEIHEIRNLFLPAGFIMLTIRLAVESCDGSFFAKEIVDFAVGVGKEAAIA